MKRLKIYLSRPISGHSYNAVVGWYEDQSESLEKMGFAILHPMLGKDALRTEKEFKSKGYGIPVSTNHAIFGRDKWMTQTADVVLVFLDSAKAVSIGCMMELAWASYIGKHTVVVMQRDNIHQHAFVLEAADIVFETLSEAMDYLKKLSS